MTTQRINRWLERDCARTFWDQCQAVPYQELLRHTEAWLEPGAGERWLDLGCGGGQLTAALWRKSGGRLAEVRAVDCNSVNAEAIQRLAGKLDPVPAPGQLSFDAADFSAGLSQFGDASFDGVVSGLAMSYAEHWDERAGRYTDHAYNRLLAELARVLRPGGRLVFSVNVPDPGFWKVFWKSLRIARRVSRPGRVVWNGLKMMGYGHWLRREARRGRFHYLPAAEVVARLERAGFSSIQQRLSYAGQAYLFSAQNTAGVAALAPNARAAC